MTTSRTDPVTFEVIWHRILDITEEMGIKYMRTSGSPILVGGYDASTGIALPDGQLVAIGPYITTQGTVLPLIIDSVQRRCTRNPGIGPGDMFVCNDPYLGATHQPDVATVAPSFREGELVAWVGASGHWLDVGGPEPGGFNMNARTVYDEGLRMPPTRIVEAGRPREDLVSLIMNQIRDPLSELDLRGQMVASQTGLDRLNELYDRYGVPRVQGVMREAIDHVERRVRARLRELPDGTWREVQYLDHDGHAPTLHKIVCTVTKRGESLRVDFSGTDPQAEGYINCTYAGARAATLSAMFIMLAYDLPWNEGVGRCLELVVPPGTVCSAVYPAPIGLATISAIIVSLTAVFAALSKMLLASPRHHEEAMASWCGTSLAPTLIGLNERGLMTVNGETSHFAAGCGARTYADGVDTGGIVINTTASIPPIETVEAEYPVLYLFRRQMVDSGGAGRFRGGVSAEVALVPHDTGGLLESAFGGTGAEAPNAYGLAGGLPGASARYLRLAGTDTERRIAAGSPLPGTLGSIQGERHVTYLKHSRAPFPRDMVEYHNWQGGGGYGDPLERDPGLVQRDVAAGLVSPEAAERIYGVALSAGQLDEPATRLLRERKRRERLASSRPASEVLQEELACPPGGPSQPAPPPTEAPAILRYGEAVEFDFGAGRCACLSCGHVLGAATADFRGGCVVQQLPLSAAGPVRGEEYDQGRLELRLYHCPNCGRQLETEVALRQGHPPAGFRLLPREP